MGAHPTCRLSTRMARDPSHSEEVESTNLHRLQAASSVGSAQPRPATLKAHKRIFKPTTGKNSIPRSPSWEYTALYKQVEGNYTRPMGFRSSTEISDPLQLKPTYWDTPPTFPPATRTAINPLSTSVVNIVEFLIQEFVNGKQYCTINSYRSSISATHLPVDGMQVRKHPLVTRLLKGVYHLRPPQPKYNGRWKVEDVLLYASSLGPTDNLSVKDQTHKLALLLALANADRTSDLQALDVRYVTFSPTGARFEVTNLTKTAKPDKSIVSFYPYFDSNPVLCPVRTLERYLMILSEWRSAPNSHRLLLSVVKPHLPVTSATIGHWLKDILRKAGVAHEFTGHSTRLTSVSIAFEKGVSIKDIMKTADWSSQNTFRRFYYKPLIEQSGSFAHAVFES